MNQSSFLQKQTPLMMAIYTKAPNSLIQSLLQSGADPHHIDSVGITVLHDAARERNIWAIKWLIAENVDLEAQTPVGPSYVPKAVFHHLLDNCYRNIKLRKMMLQDLVENLRVMQVLASAGAKISASSPGKERTQAQLIEDLCCFISEPKELANDPFNQSVTMEQTLQEIREIVNALIDMTCNPSPLSHICRVQIRKMLGRDLRRKLHQLNIPLSLRKYIMVYNDNDILL